MPSAEVKLSLGNRYRFPFSVLDASKLPACQQAAAEAPSHPSLLYTESDHQLHDSIQDRERQGQGSVKELLVTASKHCDIESNQENRRKSSN